MEDRYLFKAKRVDNGEWVYGVPFEIEGKTVILISDNENILRVHYLEENMWEADIYAIEVNPSTICQCTGLKDKNGKLIWENDICDRKEEYPEIVKYNNGDWTLDYSYSKGKESGYCCCNLGFYALERKCVEVIGNIFDNPELLESEG
jgi:uncharacterized phage protein (TIGR01671 family)